MLSSISWQQYVLFLGISTILYYLFVWVVYFKARIPSFSGITHLKTLSLHGEDQPDEVTSTAQYVIEEIRPAFSKHQNKNELLFALQQSLKKYNQWDEPDFRDMIHEFISAESKSKCSIHLSDDDLRVLWLG